MALAASKSPPSVTFTHGLGGSENAGLNWGLLKKRRDENRT